MKAVGFKRGGGRNGIGSHYCFMADPLLTIHLATRRFFCSCDGCRRKVLLGTIQDWYDGPFDQCKYWKLFKIDDGNGWNDVCILTFHPQVDCDVDELDESLVHTLRELGKSISRNVSVGGIGSYAADDVDCYYLVKWIEEPQEVKEDGIVLVEDSPMMLFKGDWTCRGRWLDKVARAKYWYTVGDTAVTVRMKNVLNADILLSSVSEENPLPRLHPSVRDQVLPLHPQKLLARDHDFMMEEIERRELLNAEEDIDGDETSVDSDGDDYEDEDSVDDADDDTDEE